MITQIVKKASDYTVFWYNALYLKSIILTYLLVRLKLCHETQSKRFKNSLYRQEPNPLWWIVFLTKILSKAQSSFSFKSISPFSSKEQSLQHSGRDISPSLSHNIRTWTDRKFPSSQAQWGIPVSYRTPGVSQSHDIETLSSADGSAGSWQIKEAPRQIVFDDDPKTVAADKGYFRFGFYGSGSLWQTGIRKGWIQPYKERQVVLSSPALLRRHYQGFPAWRITARGRPYIHWDIGTAGGFFLKAPIIRKSSNYKGGQGFLRPQDRRISGIQKGSLCYSCQGYKTCKSKTHISLIQEICLWNRDFRVCISAQRMDKEISFCGHKASHPGGAFRATEPFFSGQIQLSGYCDKSKTQAFKCLEILQWQSCRRAYHQRTQRRLSTGEDSNKTFSSQRDLFSSSSICLQSNELVQASLLADGVSKHDA